MATSNEFMEYVCEQLRDVSGITHRKMFGEYGVYCNGKIFATVCDNQLYVKPTVAGEALLGTPEMASPYAGAKLQFLISELEDREFLAELVEKTCAELPEPKAKKPGKKKQASQ